MDLTLPQVPAVLDTTGDRTAVLLGRSSRGPASFRTVLIERFGQNLFQHCLCGGRLSLRWLLLAAFDIPVDDSRCLWFTIPIGPYLDLAGGERKHDPLWTALLLRRTSLVSVNPPRLSPVPWI